MKTAIRDLNTFKPDSYEVHLDISLESMTFKGTANISGIKIGPPSQRLSFHQQNLKITHATITRHHRQLTQSMTINRINHHRSYCEVRLHTVEQLYGGSYTVSMKFSGKITDELNELFLKSIKGIDGNIKLNSDQIEHYFSGKVLPCIIGSEMTPNLKISIT